MTTLIIKKWTKIKWSITWDNLKLTFCGFVFHRLFLNHVNQIVWTWLQLDNFSFYKKLGEGTQFFLLKNSLLIGWQNFNKFYFLKILRVFKHVSYAKKEWLEYLNLIIIRWTIKIVLWNSQQTFFGNTPSLLTLLDFVIDIGLFTKIA